MINRAVLVGRLTKDPELRYTPNGVAVCRFTLAVNRTFADQSGERQADFINIVVWRKQAENSANFLKKGSLAGIEGRIQTGSYEGQDGKRVYTTEVLADSVQFLEPRNSQGSAPSAHPEAAASNQEQQKPQSQQNSYRGRDDGQHRPENNTTINDDPFATNGPIQVSDDDLPF